jgi:hypothetical protein
MSNKIAPAEEADDISYSSYDPEPVEEKSSGSDTEDFGVLLNKEIEDKEADGLITICSLEDDVKMLQASNPEKYYL